MLAKALFILLSFSFKSIAFIPPNAPYPGGVVVIDLETQEDTAPIVTFNKKRVLVVQDEELLESNTNPNWHAIIGISLKTKLGKHNIAVNSPNLGKHYREFEIKPKEYRKEHLTIKNKRKVNPLDMDQKRIAKEYIEIERTYNSYHEEKVNSVDLFVPVAGRFSSEFGLQRVFNGQPKSPHSGLDIAAIEGTKILSAKDGVVTNTGDYFYNGNMVFIDHGQGFITSYCHLQNISVKPGMKVKTGDVIGTIGMTGRVTGPHLHWSVSLNGVRVDPKYFIKSLT